MRAVLSIIASISLTWIFLCNHYAFGKKEAKEAFFHQNANKYKTNPGWQEPGLWRPKWVMDRDFEDENGEESGHDRLYLKLKSDRTIKIYTSKSRPKFQWFKKTAKSLAGKKKNLFESGDEKLLDTESQINMLQQEQEALYNTDGTWWWQDESPNPTGKVKLETYESNSQNYKVADGDDEDIDKRLLHEGRCDWGSLDGYAANFRRGKIVQYKLQKGIPLGTYKVGTWSMRANAHRPLVSKDFLAFQ